MSETLITASELRIGNLILAHGKTLPIQQIHFNYANSNHWIYFENHSGKSIEEIQPIKLTPDWLERGGFEKASNDADEECYEITHYQTYRIYLDPPSFHLQIVIPDGSGDRHYPTIMAELKFLHQLQNLYFALTNSELTFKP